MNTTKNDSRSQACRKTGVRIRNERIKSNLNQARLAILSGTTTMDVIELENGYSLPERYLEAIATALDCDLHWLKEGDAPTINTPQRERTSTAPRVEGAIPAQA